MASSIEVKIKNAAGNNNTIFPASMPPQKLSFKAKDEDWKKTCIDAIIAKGNVTYYNTRTTKYNKQVNYNLVNSIFREEDFIYITDPYGLSNTFGEAPARMENYNIIRNVIEFLKGDDLRRPFGFSAVAENGEAISTRQEYKANMLKQALAQYIQSEEAKYGLAQPPVDADGNPVQPQTPHQIEEYMTYSYKDIAEKQTNDILNYLIKKEDIVLKFTEGWEHGLISGEEIYYVGISYDEPILRVVNPLYFDYDKNPDVKTIEDAQWTREERFMTVGEILDEYREYLTEDDLIALDEEYVGLSESVSKFDAFPGYSYDSYITGNMTTANTRRAKYINVNVCCWKTWKKIGFFSYTDPENNQPRSQIVDEDFKVPNEFKLLNIPYTLEWEWINEVWSGVKIGNLIYLNIGPIENQCRTANNPSLCKMPYVGRIYSATNSVSVSMVDLLKKYQFIYNTMWYRLEVEIAKAQGKKMVIDLAQIPESKGVDLDKWLYYFTNVGIAFINSLEEGRPGDANSVSKFNQFTSIDMTVSQSIGQYISVINKIEEAVERVSGVSRQRLGDTFSSESATGIQNSVVQSSIITEFMFYNHNKVKERVLAQLVEAAKIAYQNNKTITYVTDDMQRVFLTVDSERLNNSDIGIFISNTTKDLDVKQKIEGLLQAALQNDKISMSEIIRVYKSNSIAELDNITKQVDARMQQQEEQERQHAMEMQQQQLEQAAQIHSEEREDKALDRENKLAIAQLQTIGLASRSNTPEKDNTDEISLQINEVLNKRKEASDKIRLEYDKINANQLNDDLRMQHEKEMKDRDYQIEKMKIKSKPKPAKKK
jgi:hypothetical protein